MSTAVGLIDTNILIDISRGYAPPYTRNTKDLGVFPDVKLVIPY